MITLWELGGRDDRRYSLFSWRTRMALRHKQLAFETVPVRMSDKATIAFSSGKTVPIVKDGETVVRDSWKIAEYLESRYPDAPTLFGGAIGQGVTQALNVWVDRVLVLPMLALIVADVHERVDPADEHYFRESMEKVLKMSLEETRNRRAEAMSKLNRTLEPMQALLKRQPWIAGAQPAYADYILFSIFQWARVMSSHEVLEEGPLREWRERVLDLHGGFARGSMLERIGKYEIKRLLGKGATGTVYLAADPFRQTDVAIKVMEKLPAEADAARRQLRFFQNEAALAGKLRHPHIVSIFDAGIEELTSGEVQRYLVMELVEGDSLSRYCDPHALLAPAQIVGVVYKCCKALEFANSIGVVHRDIKPANILVKGDLDIKVSDFGAAQLERADQTQVQGVGSPAYMSPEQVKDEQIDFRSDMFSLGGVLYHLLTGRRPFNGANTFALIDDILGGTPQAASQLRKGVPASIDAVLERSMAKTRDGRFESWAEFAAALGELLEIEKKETELSEAEKFAAARRLPFFKRFSDVELWEAVRHSTWRNHGEGEELIREGSEDEHLYILASGMLKVTQKGKLLNAVSAGECVGEMAYARRDGNIRSATVTAVQPSWAIRMKVQDIDELSEGCRARFIEAFLSIMADRLAMLGNRLVARV